MEKTIKHITEKPPSSFIPQYQKLLFNENRHRLLQSSKGWQSFYLINETNKRLLAEFHTCKMENGNYCPAKGPFSGLEFDERLSQERLNGFVEFITNNMEKDGSTLTVKPRPAAYSPNHFSKEVYAWLSNGYSVYSQEVHGIMDVGNTSLSTILAGSEINRLNKCQKAGFECYKSPVEEFEEIYHFTLRCRKERGQGFSMGIKQLEDLIKEYPERILLFSARKSGKLLAAAISMLVEQHSLYNFSHAHSKGYDDFSPVVFLMNGIYDYCKKNNINKIDLGSSSLNNKPNFPLIAFKERLGSNLSIKLQLEKHFS